MSFAAIRSSLAPGASLRTGLLLVLTSLGAAGLLTDVSLSRIPSYAPGEVPAQDVVAPIPYRYLDEGATRWAQEEAVRAVPPIFRYETDQVQRREIQLSAAFVTARGRLQEAADARGRVPMETQQAILHDLEETLQIRLDAQDRAILLADGFSRETEALTTELIAVGGRYPIIESRDPLPQGGPILLLSGSGGMTEERRLEDLSRLRTVEETGQAIGLYVMERLSAVPEVQRVKVAAALARRALQADCRYDAEEHQRRQEAARLSVAPVEVDVPRGKRIVRVGDPVTPAQAAELSALQSNTSGSDGGWMFLTHLAFSGVLLTSLSHFARSTIRKFAPRSQDLEAMALALLLTLTIGRALAEVGATLYGSGVLEPGLLALLVPVAGGVMLMRILINSETALAFAPVSAILTAALMDRSVFLMAWYLVTSIVAAGAVGQARERAVVLRAGLQAALIGAGLTVLMLLARQQGPGADLMALTGSRVALVAGVAMIAGFVNAILALGLVPVFEMVGFVTDYKLLELANLNHPLLKQLMLKAPGTYHHSVIVGSLSEAACEAIGANALLARVACYFHDIGKGVKPQYFVENQRDGNRHDRLSPEQSAQMIINHVRDGQLLALQYQLPKPIMDNIFMHHGTGLIQYFFNKAKEQAKEQAEQQREGAREVSPEPIDERIFRYPGPKPDSREAGVIMLADKVEAACRTIKNPDEPRIRAMIQQIINSVMADGQFEDCPLTLKELYQIADTFTAVLLGIYHQRIEYPDTRAISQGKGRYIPVPRQGAITLEIVNPLRQPPPPGSGSGAPLPGLPSGAAAADAARPAAPPAQPAALPAATLPPADSADYEHVKNLPAGKLMSLPPMDDS